MIMIENLAVMIFGKDNYYGLNIINSLIKNNMPPRAILVEKRVPLKKRALHNYVQLFRKKGLKACIRRLFRRVSDILVMLGFQESWESYNTYKKAEKDLKNFNHGLKFEDFDFKKYGIEIIYCGNNSQEAIDYINKNNIEIVIGAPKIVSGRTLELSKAKFVNSHPGYLPFFRGKNSEIWSAYYFMNPGATLHFMDAGVDTGPIIDRTFYPFKEYDSWGTIRLKGKDRCIDLYLKHINSLCKGQIRWEDTAKQDRAVGKMTSGINIREYIIARQNLKSIKRIIRKRRALGIRNPGMLTPN